MQFRYAARNLSRHRLRTAFTIMAVAFAVGLVVVGNCFITGLGDFSLAEFTRFTGHVELRHTDYQKRWRFKPLDYNIANFQALREKLAKVDGVKAVLGRIDFNLLVQYTDESTIVPEDKVVDESTLTDEQIFGRQVAEFAPAIGVEPTLEREQNKLEQRIQTGDFFTGDGAGQVVIGRELADRLGAKVGDKLQLVSFRKGVMDASVTIAGVLDTGSKIENRICYVPLALAMQLVELEDRVTQVQVFGESFRESKSLFDAISASGHASGLAMKQWNEVGYFKTIVSLLDAIIAFMFGAIIIVAVVGLLNTMLMTVLERKREIGVLMALGVSRWRVISGFLAEAAIFGTIGCVLGGIGGVLSSWPLVHYGISFDAENMRDLPMAFNPTVHGVLTTDAIFWAVLTGFLVALLGALWPAMRASSVQPLEAMRSN